MYTHVLQNMQYTNLNNVNIFVAHIEIEMVGAY